MPSLLAFVACEKVIDAAGITPSLVGIFQQMQVQVTKEKAVELPNGAVTPNAWALFSLWEIEPEAKLEFESKPQTAVVQLAFPDGSFFFKQEIPLTFDHTATWNLQYRYTANVQGFPIKMAGLYRASTWLASYENDVHHYHIRVTHQG